MAKWLKQSTAAHIMFGPFLDKTNGVDLEVGAGIITSIDHATTGIFLSKNGAAGAIRHQSVTASVLDAYGMYQVHLDTTDTDTVGTLRVMMAEAATFLPVWDDYMVLPANVYDSLMGTDLLDVNTAQWLGTACAAVTTGGVPEVDVTFIAGSAVSATTAQLGVNLVNIAGSAVSTSTAQLGVNAVQAGGTAWGSGAITAASIANGAIDNATFAADVGSTAYATNIIALAADKAIVNAALATQASVNTIDDFLDTEVAAILADTNELQTDWVQGGRLDLILDIIAADTTTDIPTLIGVAGAGLTALATAAELAKVPKSDSNVTWNATALASVNAEVDGALNTAIPGSPTADSINERVKAIDDLTQASGGGDLAALLTRIGTPANIDSGGATIADNLKKLADDNGGASFDATVSSLNKLSTAVTTGVPSTLQASANTETTGTLVSGTYASTYLSNGTSWLLAPVTPAVAEAGTTLSPFGLNANLLYTAATGQTVNSVTIRGNFNAGAGRYTNVYAYNYLTPGWDMLSDVGTRMNNTATLTSYTYPLLSAHQKKDGGGDGAGAIRIGFKSPSVTTGDRLYVDMCVVNVATANPSTADIADAVYAKLATSVYGRQVWIDTVNGVDGYGIGDNGLDHTPVKTIACAYQLCDDLGLKTIAFKSGSNATAVVLTRSAAGWRFYGPGKIDLNGQSIANAIFEECYSVYGTSIGADASFYRCQIGSTGLTLDHAYVTACRIKGAITLIYNAEPLIFQDCIDATGAGADFELIFVANATAIVRNFQGALTLKSMAATNSIVIDGACRVTIDASSTAGSITLRGFADLPTGATGNAFGTSGTITQTARFATDNTIAANMTQISSDSTAADRLEAVLDATPTGIVVDDNDPDPLATAFETNLAEASSDHYNGAFCVFTSGALLGQSRKISDYDGTTKVLTVASAFTEAPAAADAFLIIGRSE